MLNIYEQVDRNKQKSLLTIVLFIAFVIGAAYLMVTAFNFNSSLVGFAFIFAGLGSLLSYYYSDRIILSLSNAHPATRDKYFNFYTVTENLCLAASIPFPKLYVIEDTAMNAFATGRDPSHAVVCATTGLLSRLTRTELEGVIAHELSHVRNFDTRLMSVVSILVGTLTLLSDWMLRVSFFGGNRNSNNRDSGQVGLILGIIGLILTILSPLIANLIKLAISRRRELLADASAVSITKYPEGLATALEKISIDKEPLEAANKATAHLYIANPLSNRHDSIGWFSKAFSTHPPIAERVAALRAMS